MKLFPARKPFDEGFLPVGDGHELYYAQYGNRKGKPVLFVHGGPGGGCDKKAYRHFNPKKFRVVIVDQRGAGKSKPFASIKANTTDRLVEDARKLLDHLGIKKTFLFGGSWGSCLSLCFAIKYPSRVRGMVLRGIYLGTREENEYLLKGCARTHFPEVWERFVENVPKKYRWNPAPYYWKMMNSLDRKLAERYAREWARYELSMLSLRPDAEKVLKKVKSKGALAFARIEAHYLLNDAFLPPKYILKNAYKMKRIPLAIVHGRYDFVCAPETAFTLHKALPKSKLVVPIAGHSSSDPEIRENMMREIHRMAR